METSDIIKIIIVIVVLFVVFIVVGLGLDYFLGIKWYGFVQPKKENIRREVFLNTRSYNEGMIQNLIKYKYEYDKAQTEEEKQVIESSIRHMYAEFDETKIKSEELRTFLEIIKYGGK